MLLTAYYSIRAVSVREKSVRKDFWKTRQLLDPRHRTPAQASKAEWVRGRGRSEGCVRIYLQCSSNVVAKSVWEGVWSVWEVWWWVQMCSYSRSHFSSDLECRPCLRPLPSESCSLFHPSTCPSLCIHLTQCPHVEHTFIILHLCIRILSCTYLPLPSLSWPAPFRGPITKSLTEWSDTAPQTRRMTRKPLLKWWGVMIFMRCCKWHSLPTHAWWRPLSQ